MRPVCGAVSEPWLFLSRQTEDRRLTRSPILVTGDVISIHQMAQTYEKVYGIKPELQRLGSLEDLHSTMTREREKYGDNFYKYVFQ